MSLIEVRDCRSGAEVLANFREVRRRLREMTERPERHRIEAKRRALVELFRSWQPAPKPESEPDLATPCLETDNDNYEDPSISPLTRLLIDPFPRSMRRILGAVEARLGISPALILGPRRTADIVIARHCAIYIARTYTNRSMPVIARALGGRDHTTVIHAIRNVQAKLAVHEPRFVRAVASIEDELGVGGVN